MKLIDNQLVPVYETDKGNKVVDARELHEFLGSKQEFANWIKNRIEKYGFVMDEDFLITLSKTSNGGRPTTEYVLAFDTAKELAMVENNAKGRKARKYFIEIEKRFKNQQHALPQNYVEALKALISSEEEKQSLQLKIETDKPLVQFAETCMTSTKSILVREVAKLASKQGVLIGERRMFQKLRDWELFLKNRNEPTQRGMEMGLFEIKKGVYAHPDGARDFATPKVTVKGQMYIINRLLNESA